MNKKKSNNTHPTTPKLQTKKVAPRRRKGPPAVKKIPDTFPVVGIGASAGGLEAMEIFFRNLPPEPGMAFVVVQHLDPTTKGMLTELLQRTTTMKALQATDGMKVEPDHIYVIPPNADLSPCNGTLHLQKPSAERGLRLPIDFFFRSLAEDRKERSIGIILSGMGSDGSKGIKAIKEKMGMAMVQDPKSAKYDAMPWNVIKTGVVDFKAPVEDLPGKLVEYVRHATHGPREKIPENETTFKTLEQIFLLIRDRTGHDFSLYKKSSILRRIDRRISVAQVNNLSEYQRYLRNNADEIDLLFKELLIGVTSFFRDPAAFEALRKKYLPALISRAPKGSTIRAWIPGCSTGEEAYSLAIVFRECLEKVKENYKVQIFATDIDAGIVERARKGVFPHGIADEVSPKRLARFFRKDENGYMVNKEIREAVIFAVQNVIMDPPFTKIDFLSCRNLLIYLEADLQKKLIPLFYQSLNPSGLLFLGSSETAASYGDLFSALDKKWRIYAKKEGCIVPKSAREFTVPLFSPTLRMDYVKTAPKEPETSVTDLIRTTLLDKYAPPAILINKNGDILYVSGRIGKYLDPATGKASLNFMTMAREELRYEIGNTVHNALNQKSSVTIEDIRIRANGGEQYINLTVKPLKTEKENELLLVIFEEIKAPKEVLTSVKKKGDSSLKLERELQRAQGRLEKTMEEAQVAQEEYRAANEELQSTNEELQSTNEELISSKEEMQSLNEELMSVNNELQEKVNALFLAEDDMRNLLNSTEIGALFLDNTLKVRRFTPSAAKIIKLIKGDVGRPITDIATSLKFDRLAEEAEEVLEKLSTKEIEAESKDGKWYLIRILPYRSVENVIQGVVITFNDIMGLKKLEDVLRDERLFAQNIVDTVREPLVVLNGAFQVISANKAFYKTFRVSPEETEKRSLFSLGNRQWNIPELKKLLEEILPQKTSIEDFRVDHDFPNIGKRIMLLNARKIQQKTSARDLILLAIEIARA